jgi:predicted transcriptional regulator
MTDREAIDVLFNEWKCIDRNDGIHCDRKCESCDLVMDVGIIREAFNMAISALQAQELKQEVKNSKKSSLTQKGLDTIQAQDVPDTNEDILPLIEKGMSFENISKILNCGTNTVRRRMIINWEE